MILIKLFIMFFNIALFNFGGGYAMIPLISNELQMNQWLTSQEFINIIAISQMTPGAIAINTATFVGFMVANIPGALVSSIAIPLPSLIIIVILYPILEKHKNHQLIKRIFYGIRPVVAGLIISAIYFVAETALINEKYQKSTLIEILYNIKDSVNIGSLSIIIVGYILLKKKVSPMLLILLSAIAGIIIFR